MFDFGKSVSFVINFDCCMIKSMYYLCKEYHRVASVPAIIVFILTDVSLTQNVVMIYMCLFLKPLCIIRVE